jgi:EmrB/QacA subfamily drug resistance transporter
MQVYPRPEADGSIGRVPYRWVAMGVVLVGTFMVVLDTTIVNLALPSLQREFHSIDGVEWVVTSYLAAVGVAQMASGWFADRYGRKQTFVFSLGAFTIGSAVCAAAPSLAFLVGARVVQGVGGGMLIPVTMAMIYELFAPEERGRALGIWGVAVMAAPALGPVLAGTIVSSIGWRWLFIVNVPIGLVAIPLSLRLLRSTGFREARPLDRVGLVSAAIGLVLLLVGFEQGASHGFSSASTLLLLAAGVLVLAGFAVHALRRPGPILDLRILGIPVFAIGLGTLTLLTVAQYTRLVYVPLELGTTRPISALTIGFVMLPSALGVAITMPIGGRLTDRIGARLPVTLGTAILAGSFWFLGGLTPDTPLEQIALILFVGGIGTGLATMPPNIIAINAVPTTKVAQATALSSVVRQIAAAIGTAVLAAVFASIRPAGASLSSAANVGASVDAYDTIFRIGFGVLLVTLVVAQLLPARRGALELQAERRAEHERLAKIGALDLETEGALVGEVL